jgi:hypothetical protein
VDVRLKRAYEPAASSDGYRVLVDRLWPRGVSRERARLDECDRELPPNAELRKLVRPPAGALRGVSPALPRRAVPAPRADCGAPAPGAAGHADPRLLGPRRRAQRRRGSRRGHTTRAAEDPQALTETLGHVGLFAHCLGSWRQATSGYPMLPARKEPIMPTGYLTRPTSAAQPANAEAPRWPLVILELGAGLIPLFTGRVSRRRRSRRPSRPAHRKRERGGRHRRTRHATRRRMAAVPVAAGYGAL